MQFLKGFRHGPACPVAEKPLLIISQKKFPCVFSVALDQRNRNVIQHPLPMPDIFLNMQIPVGKGIFAQT